VPPGRSGVAVEGYVDVIAMVDGRIEATVAQLGQALRRTQLALLWRWMRTILCVDATGPAGRRAAYRAIDLALRSSIKPGKSRGCALAAPGARSRRAHPVRRDAGQQSQSAGNGRPLADGVMDT